MNPIKFTGHTSNEKEFVSALRKNINEYFKTNNLSIKANGAMIAKTFVMIAMYLVPFILIITVPMNGLLALGLAVLMGFGVAGVGMSVMHDANHGSYSKHKWVNDLLGGTLYLLGSNVLNWKIQHNVLHHTYTNISGYDEDINAKGPIRLSHNTPLKKFHKYQFIYAFFFYGLMTVVLLVNDFSKLFNYNRNGLVKPMNKSMWPEMIKMLVIKLIYLAIFVGLPIYLTNYSVGQIICGFLLMHWVASIILSFIFQMAHVVEGVEQPDLSPNIETDWYVHQLNTTSDFARHNKLLSWYVGGLNFQIEHHLFPNICHIHYVKLAPIVESTAKEFGFDYNLKTSFVQAFASHVAVLKDLGVNTNLTTLNKA